MAFLFIGGHKVLAQVAACGYGGTAFTGIDASTMTIGTNYTPATCYYGGEYMPLLNCTAGDAFEIWSGTAFDSQITIFQEGNATNLSNNDDNGPIQSGSAASVRFIAPANGNYRVLLNVYNCATNTTCNSINIRKVYPWGGQGATAQVPPCGSFSNLAVGSGTYTYFTGYQGSSYSVSTCTSAFDTHLTIYQLIGGVWRPISYNNNNGPDCASNSASVDFTASTTTTDYIAIVNRADNHSNAPGFGIQRWTAHDFSGTSAVLKFRENAPAAPGAAPSGGTSVCQNVAITLNRNSTPPAGITYHWVNNPTSTTSLGTGATYNPPTGTVGSVTYYIRPQSGSGCWGTASAGTTVTVTAPAGNPATFGANQWNTYAYIGGNIDLSGTYAGYYVETALSYNTLNRWTSLGSPSDASGYTGCVVGVDNHVVVSKRAGFPCGNYQLSMPNNDDDVRVYVNGNLVASGGCCNTLTAVFWTGYLGANSTIEVRHLEGGGGSNQSLTLTNIGGAPGNPATFGNGAWNVYAYNAGDAAGGSGAWTNNYSGFYTENNLNFNTTTRWGTNDSPSFANNASGAAYTGCPVAVDNHSWSAKRTNIPCGSYNIQLVHDDIGQLIINGSTVYNNAVCCGTNNIGPYVITTTDQVEFRVSEGGGGSNGSITLTATGTALAGGSITYGGSVSACTGFDPPAFGNGGDASGGASAGVTLGSSTYQWQVNAGDIPSANAATYDPPVISTPGTYVYRRRVTDKCGTVAYSNTVTITVTAQSALATLGTPNPAAGSICQGLNPSATINPGSGGGTGAADTYEYSINGGTTWSPYTSGASINSATATTSIQIRVSRSAGTGTSCAAAGPSVIITWPVSPQPTYPTLNTKTPNVSDICQGQLVSATANPGSGGSAGATDTYDYSINGGSTWTTYTPGANINTSTATGTVIVRAGRTGGTGAGCTSGSGPIATWTVSPQSVTPTLNTKTPNVASICPGTNVNATINAGSGGSPGAADTYQYSTNGGSTWSAYTSGTTINTASATTSVQVRVSRSGGSGTGCTAAGPSVIATWNISTTPAAFTPTIATTTPLCMGGNAQISIASSQSGVSYQLRNSGVNVNAAVPGTGGTIPLYTNNLAATSNTYDVVATLGSCTSTVAVPSIAVTAAPSTLANNNDNRTCYVNGNNGYVEFVSANGAMLAVNPGTQNLGNVTVTEYVNGTPVTIQACGTTQSQFASAALNRHWVISSTVAPSGPLNVRLYFGNGDFTSLSVAAAANTNPNDDVSTISNLQLNKYSGPFENATYTDNCGAGVTTLHPATSNGGMTAGNIGYNVAASSYTVHNISSFSELWLGGTNSVTPLPIVLTAFNATCEQGAVRLDWVTATEINNEKFIIHRSNNMMDWEELVTVPGAGNSNQPLGYHTVDARPLNGISYYRLTQHDYNGDSETFAPISITCYADGKGNSMMVYPNPATERYTVAIQSVMDLKNVTIELSDINGKRVSVNNVNVSQGENAFMFDVAGLNPGTYFVTVKSDELSIKPVKLIVQ